MFKLSNEDVNKSDTNIEKQSDAKASKERIWPFLLNLSIVLLMCGLLFYAVSNQLFKPRTDGGKYQCYALVFWQGKNAVKELPREQCLFIKYYSPNSIIEVMKTSRVPGR
ncbi:MAG: hypothetical protein ACXVCM_14180, partial [Ktedonobacteraceae bacterium]